MTRTFILRLLGASGLALGLSLALTAGSASAQVAMGGPYGPTSASVGNQDSRIQAWPTRPDAWQAPYATPDDRSRNVANPDNSGSRRQAQTGVTLPGSRIQGGNNRADPGRPQMGAEGVTAQACGWHALNANAYYIHCGSGRISINVEFWWGVGATRSICVWPGKTLLSSHPALQGGMITYAYYNGRGC
ncbi:DUF6355 family natural product biosynthesis protein [Saccharothrix lopnurensis]|uniref:DUF6355 family natural product biosynthesis protein n=1 Tax=Saccharothrix lopnurensis TaxID=1670621 RepID=A0ABW1P889_9PSEU